MTNRMQSTERSTRSSKRYVTEPAPDHELQKAHTDTGQYMCIECSETFDNKLELNSHRQSHVTKKQFTCYHCGRGFHHQVFLQMHERSHEDGNYRAPLTKTSASRVISTRSTKSSVDADIIHVTPTPSKSPYHLNSKVEFKREQNANQDIAPRECVTRRTQGSSPPACQRTDGSDRKTQFELRISKLSDSTIHLIDPYGNTLEILAEVFNTYTIGEPEEEEESVSPTGDSRISEISAAPSSSTVHLNMVDEVTQGLEVSSSPEAEVSEPCEPLNDGEMEEDLPLCHIQSMSSASISPKTVPDLSDDAEDVLSTKTPCESDVQDVTCNEQVVKQLVTAIATNSTEEEILPSIMKDSSITCDNQTVTEGPIVGDVCDNDLAVVAAQTVDASIKLGALDDPSSVQQKLTEVLSGGLQHTEDTLVLSKPVSPEPLMKLNDQEEDNSVSSHALVKGNEKDPSLNVSISEVNDDSAQIITCVKDSQDMNTDHVMSLSDNVIENKVQAQEETDLDEGAQLGRAEVPLTGPDKSKDITLLEDDRTTLQTPLILHECVSESNEDHKESVSFSLEDHKESVSFSPTRDPASLGLDLQTDTSTANKVWNTHVGNAEVEPKGESVSNQTTSKSNLEPGSSEAEMCRLSHEVNNEALCAVDVCFSDPDSQSADIPNQRSVSSTDHEEGSMKQDIGEKDLTLLEKQNHQPIIVPDKSPQIASGTVPILQDVQNQEPSEVDVHLGYKTDLIVPDPSRKNDGSSEPNPDNDLGVSSLLHDIPHRSSILEQDVNLRDNKETEADAAFSNVRHIGSSVNEEKHEGQDQGEAPVMAPVEVPPFTNIDTIYEASSHEIIQMSDHITKCDDVEKITTQNTSEEEVAEENSMGLLKSEPVGAGDGLLPPTDKDLSVNNCEESQDVYFSVKTPESIMFPGINAQDHVLSEETKSTEPDAAPVIKSKSTEPDAAPVIKSKSTEPDAAPVIKSDEKLTSSKSIENANLKADVLLEKLEGEDSGTKLCLLEPTLDLSPDLDVLSEKYLLSNNDGKDLAENDIDKSLSPEVPQKQYIQMSNADLTENDLADGFEGSGTILLDAPSLDETANEDISAVSVADESTLHELSDILSPEIQDDECAEGQGDKHVGIGGQCLKCGRRVRRGRKELVWFPVCYKCRVKAKRDGRHAGEGHNTGSSDFSNFHIKQETDSAQDSASYRTIKPVQSIHSIKQESPALLRKMYKCPKCEKSFRIPALLASHMKCHTSPQCVSCGCPITLKYKTKRIPKRCHKCFQKMKQQKEARALQGGEGDSLDSESGSLSVDEADVQSLTDDNEPENDKIPSSAKLVEDPKPGSVKRGTEPFHSLFMRKHKKMNPAIQALYCTCDVIVKSGAKRPKICKNCQKPVQDRLVNLPKASLVAGHHDVGRSAGGKVRQLKKSKKQPPSEPDQQNLLFGESSLSCENELSPDDDDDDDDDFCKEESEPFSELDTSDQVLPLDGTKPRFCPQCGKLFKCNRSMNLHLLSHTATQCESCGCRLKKKKRASRWSKKCRVCRLLTKDKGLSDSVIEEALPSGKIPKEKNMTSLQLKMKQSKIVRSRKLQSIAKQKKDLKWMILAVKGLTQKPRKKKEQSLKTSSEEKSSYSSESVCSGTEDKANAKEHTTPPKCDPGSSGLHISQKKTLGGISKVNRKCMYREKNIIKVEEQQLSPYNDDPSSTQVSVKEEEENQCLECNEIFSSFDLLLSHQQVHVEDQSFTCPQCPQRFSTEQYLSVHISAHAEGPPFRCLECNKTFTRRNHLGVHRRVHTGARPYACPDCPCRFRQKGSLIIHRYTHRNLQFMMLKPYQCSICNKSFKQKERLVIHERLHTGECPFSCKDCDKVFPSKSRLYVHRKIHKVTETSSSASCKEESGGQPYQCKDCDKVCSTKASFVLHCKVHKSSVVLDQSSSREGNLEQTTDEVPLVSEHSVQIKTEPEGHPFTCKDCNKVCSTKASLVLHRKVHSLDQRSNVGSPTFVCKDCKKVCSTKASLVLHRKVHKSPLIRDLKTKIGDPPYICQDCNKVCSTKASFVLHCKVHKASSIGEQKSFVCKDCQFVCSTKASFVLHRKVHRPSLSLVQNPTGGTGEHPFTCKDCNKVCSTKASFVLHCKVHKALPGSADSDQSLIPQADAEEKPYHCKDCGKIYSTKGRLLSHIKLHTGQDGSSDGQQLKMDTEEKPFACSVCQMRFTRLKILVRHKLLHGEDVFRCGHCGKRFLFQKSLMNHVPVCLKRSKAKGLLGKEKVPKKRKSKDASNSEESAPKKRKKQTKKAVTAVQKLKNKKLIKAKKLAISKEKSKAKSSHEKKPKKPKGDAEQGPVAEGEKQIDGKQERLLETQSKEKEISKDKKTKDVGKVKKALKKVPAKQKRQKVSGESLKKWRIIAAATVKKRKLQAAISGGKKKVTIKKKGPSKAKTGGKNIKE